MVGVGIETVSRTSHGDQARAQAQGPGPGPATGTRHRDWARYQPQGPAPETMNGSRHSEQQAQRPGTETNQGDRHGDAAETTIFTCTATLEEPNRTPGGATGCTQEVLLRQSSEPHSFFEPVCVRLALIS